MIVLRLFIHKVGQMNGSIVMELIEVDYLNSMVRFAQMISEKRLQFGLFHVNNVTTQIVIEMNINFMSLQDSWYICAEHCEVVAKRFVIQLFCFLCAQYIYINLFI